MTTVKPVKPMAHPGVHRIDPKSLTIDRLRAAMDAQGKPSSITQNVVALLTGKAVPRG